MGNMGKYFKQREKREEMASHPPCCDAIVFDFDGTLVDSNEIKTQAFGKLYESEGAAIVEQVKEYHHKNEGLSRFVKFRHWEENLLHRPYTEHRGQSLSEQYSRLVLDAVVQAPYISGAQEFLETYHKLTPLYVASGTPESELRFIVSRRQMSHYFQGVFGSPATKAEILNRIIPLTGKPTRILMVGDALADLEGAQIAGTQFLGIITPDRTNIFPPEVHCLPDLQGLSTLILHS